MSDFANKSLQRNIMKICEKMSNKELLDLSNYLAYGFLEGGMSETTEIAVTEMFGLNSWLEFVQNEHKRRDKDKQTYFISRPRFDLDNIRAIIMFYITKRFDLAIMEIDILKGQIDIKEKEKKILKLRIKGAVDESYYDGIFDKCDGWCNVADVLIDEKILELPEE